MTVNKVDWGILFWPRVDFFADGDLQIGNIKIINDQEKCGDSHIADPVL